jgi:hypothetical protein
MKLPEIALVPQGLFLPLIPAATINSSAPLLFQSQAGSPRSSLVVGWRDTENQA